LPRSQIKNPIGRHSRHDQKVESFVVCGSSEDKAGCHHAGLEEISKEEEWCANHCLSRATAAEVGSKSLGCNIRGPVPLVHAQELQFLKKQKTHSVESRRHSPKGPVKL